jgi:hypothetical protein
MAEVMQAVPLTMGWCIECHRAPEAHLRPRDKVTEMDWMPRGDREALGRQLAVKNGVERLTHCSTCHR